MPELDCVPILTSGEQVRCSDHRKRTEITESKGHVVVVFALSNSTDDIIPSAQ